MDSFNFHKLQAEKVNAILKHRQLRKIANLLRYVEVCVVLVMISRLSIQLPVVVKNSSEYFRGFSVFVVSPRFVFLVGNIIIIALFAQSGQFSSHGSAKTNPEPDLYQEFLQNSTHYQKIQADQTKHPEKPSIGTEDIKQIQKVVGDRVRYPGKLSIRTGNSIKGQRIDGCLIKYPEKQSTKTEDRIKDQRKTNISLEVKDYRRCQSEIISRVKGEKPRRVVLQRCETENSRRSIEAAAAPAERVAVARTSYPEDGMSNEEFRRTIDAFIARQQRLRRQEEQCFTP